MVTLVRRANADDAHVIATVHVLSWQAAYRDAFPPTLLASLSVSQREERWRSVLSDDDAGVFVAEVDDVVVGFASAGASRDPDAAGARVGELHTIYVHPDRWGTGTGGRLHDAAMRELVRCGFEQVSLWVLDSNTRARQFYERRGWAPDGEVKHEERGGTPTLEVRYRRALAAGREWAKSGGHST